MVLHFAKYVGRLAPGNSFDRILVERTMVDTFIIVLAISNALNLDLANRVKFGSGSLGLRVSEHATDEAFAMSLFISMAQVTGRLAKACESLDHVEDFDSRKELERGVAELCAISLAAALRLDIDLAERTKSKWSALERKNVFDS